RFYILLCVLISWSLHAIAQDSVSTNGNKYVLFESVNSVGVHFSPDADIIINQIKNTTPNAIFAIFHHNYDSYHDLMQIQEGVNYASTYLTGYPTGTADRTITSASSNISVNKNLYAQAINDRLTAAASYDITMTHTYNFNTRQIAVNLKGTALVSLGGNYHFNVYVIEDSVSGTGPGYDQKITLYNTPVGHPAFGLGDPIVGYEHPVVVRAVLAADIWGDFAVA